MVLIERAERGECSEGNSEKSEIIEESEVRMRFYKVKSEGCEAGFFFMDSFLLSRRLLYFYGP